MTGQDKTIEKLSMIEKVINEIGELRQQVVELKESETQRQKAMAGLESNEKRYKILFENLPQKLFMKDRNSVYMLCNRSFARDLNKTPEEISGKADMEFFPERLAQKQIADDKRIMETGILENFEEEYSQNGQRRMVHTVKTPLRDENGEILGILGISWDITEQKRNEEEMRKSHTQLRELASSLSAELQGVTAQLQKEITERGRVDQQVRQAEGRWQALLENTGTATLILKEDLTISRANQKFLSLSGYAPEAVVGKKLSEFIPEEGMKDFFPAGRATPDGSPATFNGPFLGQGGRRLDVGLKIAMIPGTKEGVASILDRTGRKEAEQELRSSLEPFRALVNAMEKILDSLNRV